MKINEDPLPLSQEIAILQFLQFFQRFLKKNHSFLQFFEGFSLLFCKKMILHWFLLVFVVHASKPAS